MPNTVSTSDVLVPSHYKYCAAGRVGGTTKSSVLGGGAGSDIASRRRAKGLLSLAMHAPFTDCT